MAQTTKTKTKAAALTDNSVGGGDDYLDSQEVATLLGITVEEHYDRTGHDYYPKAVYINGGFMGFLRSDIQKYRDGELAKSAATDSKVDSTPAPDVKTEEVAVPEIDPSVEFDPMTIPTTGIDHTLSLAFSAGFSTQWSPDDLLRWKKLICGLVRSNQRYVSYQDKDRIVEVRSNIQDALKWLLRTAVPLTQAELEYLNLHNKSLGNERDIAELKQG